MSTQEHDDRAYSVEAFFAAYNCFEFPFGVIAALLFSLLGSIAVDLRRTVGMYFIIALNCFCIVSCGESLGIIFNTFFSSTGFALTITSVVLSIGQFMSVRPFIQSRIVTDSSSIGLDERGYAWVLPGNQLYLAAEIRHCKYVAVYNAGHGVHL